MPNGKPGDDLLTTSAQVPWQRRTPTIALGIVAIVLAIAFAVGPLLLRPTADCEYLKYLGHSALNYKEMYGRLPSAVLFDRDGRRMHSWRVIMMPFIEANSFFGGYDFESAWDSPANANLATGGVVHEKAAKQWPYPNPKAYPAEAKRAYKTTSGRAAAGDFTTEYLMVIRGDEALVPSDGPAVRPEGKGWRTMAAADEVLIVQVRKSRVPWTEPKDIVLTSPAPEWGIPLAEVREDILGSVVVTPAGVTCHDREATLRVLDNGQVVAEAAGD